MDCTEVTGQRIKRSYVRGQRVQRSEVRENIGQRVTTGRSSPAGTPVAWTVQRSEVRLQRSEVREYRGQRSKSTEVRKYIGRGQNVIHRQIFTSRHTRSMDWYPGQSSEGRFL
jgi:hypothetical protein